MSATSTRNLGPQLFAIAIAFPALSALTVIVRMYICTFITRKFKLDDYLVITALITSLASAGFLFPSISSGLGQPITDLFPSAIVRALKWLFIATTVRATALYFAKLSITICLLSIRKSKNTSRVLYVIIGILSTGWVFSQVVIFAQCAPLERKWEIFQQINKREGRCWDKKLLFIYQLIEDAFGILTSLMLLSVAALLIRQTSLTSASRLGVSLILMLGTLTAVLSIQLTILSATSLESDTTILTVPAVVALWSTIHLHLAIIVASLPSIRFHPIPASIKRILNPHTSAAKQYKKSGRKPISTSQISNPRPTVLPSYVPFPSPMFALGDLPTHSSTPLQPLHHSPNPHTQTSKYLSTKKTKMYCKREALFALEEDVGKNIKPGARKGVMEWREVSFRQSTQDFLLGLFPRPNKVPKEEARDSWG